jgi:Zn-dependent peptidase ImmA (M78 family)
MELWERANRGRWRATQLLNRIPGAFRAPVPVLDIAASMGIGVFDVDIAEDGFIRYDGEKAPEVFLGNPRASIGRSRFTLAHELAHAVLHLDLGVPREMPRDTFGVETSVSEEAEANAFAANLLVPFELLDVIGPSVMWDADSLANTFGVSKSMIHIRMGQRSLPGRRYGR